MLLCMFFVHIMYFPLFCCCNASVFVICAIKNYLLTYLLRICITVCSEKELFSLEILFCAQFSLTSSCMWFVILRLVLVSRYLCITIIKICNHESKL